MRIMVTGSKGFIGQHLLLRLSTIGEVVELQSDLTNHAAIQAEVKSIAPDIVVHLAARTEVQKSFYEQVSFSEVNYVGTVNLIEACRSVDPMPYFVFASTMEVYGWQPISDEVEETGTYKENVAFDEHTQPHPNAPYAVAKYACEKYLEYAERAYGLEWASFRQTNSYGRKDNDYFVTEQIIAQMLRGDVCNLGYAEPYRNFIYIDDLLDAWMAVIKNRNICRGNIFTIGPDDPRKIKDCANYIAEQLDWHGTINWDTKPPRHGEIYWLNSNHTLLTEKTGWIPKISYEEGIAKTIKHWKVKLGNHATTS
jgi:nucleoside-diphosphate-sugar epimerase